MELGERWGRIKWKKAVAFLKKSDAKKLLLLGFAAENARALRTEVFWRRFFTKKRPLS